MNDQGIFAEEELLPISALQHLAFCERQWALIHLEQLWAENTLTIEGKFLHEKVHEEDDERRGNVRILRSARLRSFRLGLVGMADLIEYPLDGVQGEPLLVEYKRGKPKLDRCDEVQLCAQALCLEEMTGAHCGKGAFFYGRPRRRHFVEFSTELREEVRRLAEHLHVMQRLGKTPPARYEPKCEHCSLFDLCLPRITQGTQSARRYVRGLIRDVSEEVITE